MQCGWQRQSIALEYIHHTKYFVFESHSKIQSIVNSEHAMLVYHIVCVTGVISKETEKRGRKRNKVRVRMKREEEGLLTTKSFQTKQHNI